MMRCALMLLFVSVTGLVGQVEEFRYRREGDGEVTGRGTMSIRPDAVSIRCEDAGSVISATILMDAGGEILSWEREIRAKEPDALIGRVSARRRGQGYDLREEGPVSSRTVRVAASAVQGVVDPACPEGLLATFMTPRQGFLTVLVLATGSTHTVEVEVQAEGTRRMKLPDGEVRVEQDAAGGFVRMSFLGAPRLDVVREGIEADTPPAGVFDEALEIEVGEGIARVDARWTRPASEEGLTGLALILPDDRTSGPDGVGGDETGRPLLRDLAYHLAQRGIGSLRIERRGGPRGDPRLDDLVRDARSAFETLAGKAPDRKLPRSVIAHGAGALVALKLPAAEGGSTAVVLLGPSLSPLSKLLEETLERERLRLGDSPEAVEDAVVALRQDLAELRAVPAGAEAGPGRQWLRDVLDLDPIHMVHAFQGPVLVLVGGRDEVPLQKLAILRSTMAFAPPRSIRTQTIQDAGHRFERPDGSRHPDLFPIVQSFLEEFGAAGKKGGG